MKDKNIVMLACEGTSTRIMYHSLCKEWNISRVIIENKPGLKNVFKRKIKKHGVINSIGQFAFMLLIAKPQQYLSGKRIAEIIKSKGLNESEMPGEIISKVNSVNSKECIQLLSELKPDLIIVNGTRILSRKLISSVSCKMLNMHAGITPKYRGVHGAYWALINKDIENAGVTVHYIDEGVDTGGIISQTSVSFTPTDNFSTFPHLQLAAGLPLLSNAIREHFEGSLILREVKMESRQWYHPTIWQYLFNRLFKGVK